jgi:hypothetical protein|nr:MAG TPA: hypothetical protein [Bacteriophage sp.]
MNKFVEKAMQLIEESERTDTTIPDLEVGDVVRLWDVWDGESETGIDPYNYHVGEEYSSSYMVNGTDGINYLFKIVECGEKVEPEIGKYEEYTNLDEAAEALRDAVVEITDIYLI